MLCIETTPGPLLPQSQAEPPESVLSDQGGDQHTPTLPRGSRLPLWRISLDSLSGWRCGLWGQGPAAPGKFCDAWELSLSEPELLTCNRPKALLYETRLASAQPSCWHECQSSREGAQALQSSLLKPPSSQMQKIGTGPLHTHLLPNMPHEWWLQTASPASLPQPLAVPPGYV